MAPPAIVSQRAFYFGEPATPQMHENWVQAGNMAIVACRWRFNATGPGVTMSNVNGDTWIPIYTTATKGIFICNSLNAAGPDIVTCEYGGTGIAFEAASMSVEISNGVLPNSIGTLNAVSDLTQAASLDYPQLNFSLPSFASGVGDWATSIIVVKSATGETLDIAVVLPDASWASIPPIGWSNVFTAANNIDTGFPGEEVANSDLLTNAQAMMFSQFQAGPSTGRRRIQVFVVTS